MAVYMIERDLPGITLEQLGGAQKAAIETSQVFTSKFTRPGDHIAPWLAVAVAKHLQHRWIRRGCNLEPLLGNPIEIVADKPFELR